MSFGYPPLRPLPGGIAQRTDQDDLPDYLTQGPSNVRNKLQSSHPLETSERNWQKNRAQMDFVMLRNLQGVHAPLRLHMERRSAAQVGRLPVMASSNIMHDSLTGKLDTIEFDDIFSVPTEAEVIGHPHALLEKKNNIL